MKIVCLIRALSLGGAERQMVGLACGLSAAGHEVNLVVYHRNDYYKKECEAKGVKTVLLSKGSFGSLAFSAKLASYIRKEEVEVLIAFLPGPCTKACIAKMLFPHFKLIVSERNFNTSYLPHDLFRFSLYRLADEVVCNNHSQEAFIREHCHWLNPKLSTIVNFASLDSFSPANGKDTAPVRKIIVAARLCPRKNPIGLIKAAELLKDKGYTFRIEWYGADDSTYRKRMEKAIRKHNVSSCFFLHQASHEMPEIYRAADIFCLPSLYEGTSNAIAEALCCGLPVVASAVSDTPLYVNDGVNGCLAKPGDVKSLSEALEKALNLSDEQLREFGKKSRTSAEKGFNLTLFRESWKKLVQKTVLF